MASSMALGQWSDNFDSYAVGDINGLGGWVPWDNAGPASGAVTAAVSRSAPNSQIIEGPDDSVGLVTGVITDGEWRYTAWMFIPDAFTGTTFFILNNRYNHGGPYTWVGQMPFVGSTGRVGDDMRIDTGANIVRGRWAEIRFDFDLGPNTCTTYYDGVQLSTGAFAIGTPGPANPLTLAGVDLYANNASPVYYDDLALEYIGPGAGRCPTCPADFNEDGGVDGGDVEAFFTAWEAGVNCGDVNADGGVDGADVEEFYYLWENNIC